jgi:predicted ATP-binding protein involved in virulence
MRINKIILEGYRGFSNKVEIEFHPTTNLFVGLNGSGKTTILDAVAMFLQIFIAKIRNDSLRNLPNHLADDDISNDKNYSANSVEVFFRESRKTIRWSSQKERFYNDKQSDYQELNEFIKEYWQPLIDNLVNSQSHELLAFPIICFYPANRLYRKENGRKTKKKKYPVYAFNTYDNALESQISSFEDFEEWYIGEENSENRKRLREDENYVNPNLAPIRKAIELFYNEISGASGYSRLYVDEQMEEDGRGIKGKPTLFIHKNGYPLKLEKLSDGERMLLLLVSDIARRLTIANTLNEVVRSLHGDGIVLIDEIELHLHPSWQRGVVPALTKVFPNIQFILTTHSPQVLSNVRHDCIHIIEDFNIVPNTPPTFGKDSNSILWDIYGDKGRPEHSEKAFSEFYDSLEKDDQKLAQKTLDKLIKKYGKDRADVQQAIMKFEFTFEFGEEEK